MTPTAPEAALSEKPLTPELLDKIDRYWRACNYLSAGMIYLQDNPLLREPLRAQHIKNRLLGHWGASPGLSFMWVHLNRLINMHDLDAIFLAGPGHGAPGVLSPTYLEGTYSEIYPEKSEDEEGMRQFFKQFSFPGGIGSHCTPETPGSIHEGGELGYSLSHAFGAAFDNPDLLVAVAVGDGESETGPLATAWHSNKFLSPVRDGAVLPILHLNGYKINNPTILSRISHEELEQLFRGYGWTPHFVEGDEPEAMHQRMAATLDRCFAEIRAIQQQARTTGVATRARWPMIVLRTPKGWTGPKEVDGKKVEGFWRAHQVPLAGIHDNPEHLAQLEAWLRSYRAAGALRREGAADSGAAGAGAEGCAAHERQPSRQRRAAAPGPADARLSGSTPRTSRSRRSSSSRTRAPWAASCATSCATTWTTSASSGRTRTPRTSSTPSTRSARSSGWPTICPRMPTAASWRPTVASWRCCRSTRSRAGTRATC